MRNIKYFLIYLLLFTIVLSQGVSVYGSTKELPSGITYDSIGSKIAEYVLEHEDTTAGMAISVFHCHEDIYIDYFGYADREKEIPVTQDTVMEWGSATKLLVWVSVMQLWEEGLIDIETDIKEYLPENFLTNLNFKTPITMLHLMNHTAGFQEGYADLFVKDFDSIGTLESSLKAHEPSQIYEPGTVTSYSNWGVALAGYIVERISGENFDEYVHNHIFEPLGMKFSAISADLSDNPVVQEKRKELQCYTTNGQLIPDCFYYITLYPAGMCTSTLSDFQIFAKALLNKDSLLFQKNDTWNTLFTPSSYLGDSDIPSNYHGFWVIPYGVETIGHGGNTAGCSSYLLLDLQNEIGTVVMTNQSQETNYNGDMMKLIFGEYSADTYYDTDRIKPEGIYRTARTIRVGPFKLLSLSFQFGDWEDNQLWMTGASGEIEKICYPYGDFVRIPFWKVVLEVSLFSLWVIAVLFSVVSLLVKLIRKIICIFRKKEVDIPLGKWITVSSIIQIITVILLVIVASLALSYAESYKYTWMLSIFGVIIVFMIGLIIYGFMKLRIIKKTRIILIYNYVTIFFLMITIVNILYWNLFMWWKL